MQCMGLSGMCVVQGSSLPEKVQFRVQVPRFRSTDGFGGWV